MHIFYATIIPNRLSQVVHSALRHTAQRNVFSFATPDNDFITDDTYLGPFPKKELSSFSMLLYLRNDLNHL